MTINHPADHNIPGLPSLSHEEITCVEAAREALATMKRTFEFWTVIARGLKALKDKADRIGGRFTFDRLREREGLGGKRRDGTDILNKTRVSRLLAILDNEAAVVTWRAKLSPKQQFDWASPEAVFRHCPAFAGPDDDGEPKLTPVQQRDQIIATLEEENHRLKRQKEDERFTPTDTAENVAVTLVGMFSPNKVKDIIRRAETLLKRRAIKSAKDTPIIDVVSHSGR